MKTIEALLISRGELDRIYVGKLNLYLWRSLHKSVKTANPLYPDFDPREVRAGVLRPPDVLVEAIDGIPNVISKLGQGTSLFDEPGVFGPGNWVYFEIPAGTEIPHGLIIVRDEYNEKYKATHYSLSPNETMTKERFMFLLDVLAANARARSAKVSSGRT